MYCDRRLLPWFDRLRRDLPDLDIFDAHVHVGLNDPGGFNATVEEATEALDLTDSRGLLFPLKEPEGYDEANAQVISYASASNGRLAALARLDPEDDPTGKARHWVDEGAVGIKLHTSSERFALTDPRLDGVFALAHAERLPIMVHTGPSVVGECDQAVERAREYPNARIILAHAALGGQAWLWKELPGLPNIFVDTSWWGPGAILSLMALIPPGRILYASDIPFASSAEAALLTLRCAMQSGYDHDQLRSLMGGQLDRLVKREDPFDVGPAPGAADAIHPLLERTYVTLLTVVEGMMRGGEAGQGLAFARASCNVPDDFPHRDICRSIEMLIDAVETAGEADELRPGRTAGFDLALIGALLARTPLAPVPDEADVAS